MRQWNSLCCLFTHSSWRHLKNKRPPGSGPTDLRSCVRDARCPCAQPGSGLCPACFTPAARLGRTRKRSEHSPHPLQGEFVVCLMFNDTWASLLREHAQLLRGRVADGISRDVCAGVADPDGGLCDASLLKCFAHRPLPRRPSSSSTSLVRRQRALQRPRLFFSLRFLQFKP